MCVCVCCLSAESCPVPCLNGGQCVQSGSCDCSLYQATGHRCQTGEPQPFTQVQFNFIQIYILFLNRTSTEAHSSADIQPHFYSKCHFLHETTVILSIFLSPVPNPGFEREMTCRTWAQYNFETFDGLYYYFPGRCTYTLLRDCGETSKAGMVVQVRPTFRLQAPRMLSALCQLLAQESSKSKNTLSLLMFKRFRLSPREGFILKISESNLVIKVNYN